MLCRYSNNDFTSEDGSLLIKHLGSVNPGTFDDTDTDTGMCLCVHFNLLPDLSLSGSKILSKS